MKYLGLPAGMWALFAASFQQKLTELLGHDRAEAAQITKKAHGRYRELIAKLPDFERGDRFPMNIASCAMLAAFILGLPQRPCVEELADYYAAAMMTGPMKAFCRMGGKAKFSSRDIEGMKNTAALNAADRNPYSWNMEFLPYADGNGYEARFSHCGICTLMKELGLFEYVPALCRLDYTMSEVGGATEFVRQYTLASGGPYIRRKRGKAVPCAKKVSASHRSGEVSFLTEAAVDESLLKDAVAATGYACLSASSEPYDKKGLFKW